MNTVKIKVWLWLFISTLLLGSCTNSYKVIESSSANNTVISDLSTTDSLYVITMPYKTKLESSMSEVLNESVIDMEVGVPEGLLNNFIGDLTLSVARRKSSASVDVSLLNNGGLRTPLLKGPVTRRMIFELMPFENELIVLDLKGEQMIELINYVVERSLGGIARTGVSLSGMRVTISNGKATHVMIGTQVFEEDRTYRVVTSDYLAGGGDEMFFFEKASAAENLDLKLRDAIINYLTEINNKGIKIDAELDGRVYISE